MHRPRQVRIRPVRVLDEDRGHDRLTGLHRLGDHLRQLRQRQGSGLRTRGLPQEVQQRVEVVDGGNRGFAHQVGGVADARVSVGGHLGGGLQDPRVQGDDREPVAHDVVDLTGDALTLAAARDLVPQSGADLALLLDVLTGLVRHPHGSHQQTQAHGDADAQGSEHDDRPVGDLDVDVGGGARRGQEGLDH